jgi:hypothetical protein
VLTIPKERVVEQIELCATLGVGGAVIFSSGFSEGGDANGTALQDRISAVLARERRARAGSELHRHREPDRPRRHHLSARVERLARRHRVHRPRCAKRRDSDR